MKRVLITGAGSYIGEKTKEYLEKEPDNYSVDIVDTIDWQPTPTDFEGYDVVFNVAGIAHRKETKENRHLYYEVNRDLAIAIAKAAKDAGVNQFILLSSMAVYGKMEGRITKNTRVSPVNAYGESKAQADDVIKNMANDDFRFVCLRPPMVYGNACKGNYQKLRLLALKSPIFPDINNERSMLYIGNLCEFVRVCINENRYGLFFPQNDRFVNTAEMVKMIADINGKHIRLVKAFNWMIKCVPINTVKKVFGSLTYEPVDTVSKYNLKDSLLLTELVRE